MMHDVDRKQKWKIPGRAVRQAGESNGNWREKLSKEELGWVVGSRRAQALCRARDHSCVEKRVAVCVRLPGRICAEGWLVFGNKSRQKTGHRKKQRNFLGMAMRCDAKNNHNQLIEFLTISVMTTDVQAYGR